MITKKARSIIKKAAWITFLVIFGFVAVIAVWLTVSKFILKSPAPSVFGYATLTVATGSMSGTIEPGDMIVIKKQDEYKIGDIIAYIPEGDKIPTTHRIVNYHPDGSFKTRGDANNTADSEHVTNDIILGKVVKTVSGMGVFATWIRTEGWIYIVACLAIVGLGLFIVTSLEDKKSVPDARKEEKSEDLPESDIESNGEDSKEENNEQLITF